MVVAGNLYSVPDTTRRRILDIHVFADEIRADLVPEPIRSAAGDLVACGG
jgi:hypothetical protein